MHARLLVPALAVPLLALAPAPPVAAQPGPNAPEAAQSGAVQPRADAPEVRRSVTLLLGGDEPGAWKGTLTFGLVATGTTDARLVRAVPLQLRLERRTCDLGGCVVTTMEVPDGSAVPSAVRMSQVSSAALGRTVLGVVVTRTVDGAASIEQFGTVTISARARRSGPIVRETTLIQSGGTEVMTIRLTAPVRATVQLADDTVVATGTAEKTSIVG